eukprot:Polyplicarium_translucidae@DN683_c0_g1_i1.p1
MVKGNTGTRTGPRKIILDGHRHLLGRLASVVAKQLLNGERIVVTRCEEINIAGSLYRNKVKFQNFLRKKSASNPRKHSHIHHRAPSKIFERTVRGMLPHKQKRGAMALANLIALDGVPHAYEKKRRLVCPGALTALRLRPQRDVCRLGDLSSRVGWNKNELLVRMEDRRRERSQAYYESKKEYIEKMKAIRDQATAALSAEDRELLMSVGRA